MRTVSQSDAVATLPMLIDEVQTQPVAIERNGEEVAVIVTPEEYELIRGRKIQLLLDSMDAIAVSVQNTVANDMERQDLLRTLDRKAS
jgi:PHD/YefM family antitoxin component YafN of YafNO toxin-antitoxin module